MLPFKRKKEEIEKDEEEKDLEGTKPVKKVRRRKKKPAPFMHEREKLSYADPKAIQQCRI